MDRKVVAVDLSSTKDTWETPPAVFEKLDQDFGPFDIDLTANPHNRLCRDWLGPGSPLHEDALVERWGRWGVNGYSNPPYGAFIPQILRRARYHFDEEDFVTTLLLPLRITKSFRKDILEWASDLYFCDRRICFYEGGQPRWNQKALAQGKHRPDPAMFDSIVVRFDLREASGLHVGVWHVPDHVPWRTQP